MMPHSPNHPVTESSNHEVTQPRHRPAAPPTVRRWRQRAPVRAEKRGASGCLILLFALAFLVFMVLPPFLEWPFPPFPYMRVEDAFTLLTPFVLIPLYWLMLRSATGHRISTPATLVFLLLTILWVDGHGIKLSANSIENWFSQNSSPHWELMHFYDEVLGHYLWHAGLIGLSALLVIEEWRHPATVKPPSFRMLALAGVIYGLVFFAATDEGETVTLGLPFALAFVWLAFRHGRARWKEQPLLTFFLVGYGISLALYAAWGIYWRGFPEISSLYMK